MRAKLIAVTIFALCMAGAFFYFEFEPEPGVTADDSALKAATRDELEQAYNDSWNRDEAVESRLPFQKKLAVIHVGELNSDAFADPWGIDVDVRHASLNPNTQALYYYDQEVIPTAEDNMVVIYDVNSLEVLLQEDVYHAADQVELPFAAIAEGSEDIEASDWVVEEARLYANQPMRVELLDASGRVEIDFNGQNKLLQPGEKAVFDTTGKVNDIQVRSKVVVSNYGMWDASNMKYAVSRAEGGD